MNKKEELQQVIEEYFDYFNSVDFHYSQDQSCQFLDIKTFENCRYRVEFTAKGWAVSNWS